MDFANLNTDSTNAEVKAVSFFDFTQVLEAIGLVLTGKASSPFYLGVTIDGLWKSAVYTAYYAHKNSCGDHAPAYIEIQEKRILEAEGLIDWLFSKNFEPKGDSTLIEVLKGIQERDALTNNQRIHMEMVEEVEDYEEYGAYEDMNQDKAIEIYDSLPITAKQELDEIIEAYKTTDKADSSEANKLTHSTIDTLEYKPGTTSVSGEYLYVQLAKIRDKLDTWTHNAKVGYRKAKTQNKNNTKFLEEKKNNHKMLQDAYNMANKICKEAETIDNSNTAPEISNMIDDLTSDNLDTPAGFDNKEFNEGFITP